MFSGGVDPEWMKWMQKRAEMLKNIAPSHSWLMSESAMRRLWQSGAFKHQEGHYAALQQALKNTPPSSPYQLSPAVTNSLQNAVGILDSPGVETVWS